MSSKINPENKCSHLYENFKDEDKLQSPLRDIFNMQLSLQKKLAATGRGVDYENADFMTNIKDISIQWRNLSLEFAELLERLPYKEWKTYAPEKLTPEGYSEEQTLETLYEYADMFHFFINIGLALGVDGDALERLYVTKNKENFDRQKRGY
jgi:dimeric dUTPase (all-alpha-NTP-PPase superfamily)